MLKVGQKVGPKVGFPVEEKRKAYFRTCVWPTLSIPPKPTFELLLGYFIFLGISGLVAHEARHNLCKFSSRPLHFSHTALPALDIVSTPPTLWGKDVCGAFAQAQV